MAFRDINPSPLNPLAYGDMVASIGTNILAGEERGMQKALLMDQVGRDMATRNALAGYFATPEEQRGVALNELAALDPQVASDVFTIESAQRERAEAERRAQALDEYTKAEWVLKQESPATAIRLLDSDGSFHQQLHDAGIINLEDGISDEEAVIIARWARDTTAPIAGITLERPDSPFAKINPADYTPESVAAFQAGGARDFSQLVPRAENGAAADPFSDVDASKYTAESIAAFQRSARAGEPDYSLLVPRGEGDKPVGLDEVRSFRNDVIRNSEDFRQRQMAYENVVSASRNPSPANDLALLFAVAKVYDPGSIVREGELQMSQSAGDIAQRLGASFKQVFQGERLTDGQRRDFVESARSQFESSNKQQQRLIADARGFAERNRLPIDDVVPSYLLPTELGSAAPRGASRPTAAQRAGNAVEQAIDAALAPAPAPSALQQFEDGTTVEWID